MTGPGQSPCIGVVIDELIDALRLSRTTVSTCYLAATCLSAACLPAMGRLIDRAGPRKMVFLIALGLGAACGLLASARSTATLLPAFFLLRFFGQGSMGLVAQTEINLWWVRRRGVLMSYGRAVMSLAIMSLFPVLMRALADRYGWRAMYWQLGAAEVLLMAPLGLVFFRDAPEKYGMRPDAAAAAPPAQLAAEPAAATVAGGAVIDGAPASGVVAASDAVLEVNWTKSEAIRTRAFWAIALGVATRSLVGTALWFHLHAVLVDGGLSSESQQAGMYAVLAVTSVLSTLASGCFIDRGMRPARLLGHSLLMTALSMLLMTRASRLSLLAVGAMQGLSQGLASTISAVTYANYFGRAELGAISGLANSLSVLGSALGPLPFGMVKDATGSFDRAFLAATALSLVAALGTFAFGAQPLKCGATSALPPAAITPAPASPQTSEPTVELRVAVAEQPIRGQI
jgi:sugar phosphate permease